MNFKVEINVRHGIRYIIKRFIESNNHISKDCCWYRYLQYLKSVYQNKRNKQEWAIKNIAEKYTNRIQGSES